MAQGIIGSYPKLPITLLLYPEIELLKHKKCRFTKKIGNLDLIADLTRNPHLGADAIRRAHRAGELLDHGSAGVFKREFGVTPREYACEKLKKENR